MKKHLPTVLRILLGLIFTAASIAGFTGKVPPPEPEPAQAFMGVLLSSGLLYIIKLLELICGLALMSGYYVPLALVVLAPIITNILFFGIALDPAGTMIGVTVSVLWILNAREHRTVLLPLLSSRATTTKV